MIKEKILTMQDSETRSKTINTDKHSKDLIKKWEIEGYNVKEAALLTNIPYEAAKNHFHI